MWISWHLSKGKIQHPLWAWHFPIWSSHYTCTEPPLWNSNLLTFTGTSSCFCICYGFIFVLHLSDGNEFSKLLVGLSRTLASTFLCDSTTICWTSWVSHDVSLQPVPSRECFLFQEGINRHFWIEKALDNNMEVYASEKILHYCISEENR